jgi:dynamin GTPase
MEAIEELSQLSESIMQAAALLADEDVDENSSSSSRRNSTFLNVVALGNVVSDLIYRMDLNFFK